ncbi:MAG: alpha/beta hydrolase [Microbacterium sp.]|uniref:alpha/beta fold hydrolase n=1 Tax=Microbacterium sp. TaxID=51671 RepID=UPI0019A47ED2|nr:alpha/beta hydrolase [Microbacterium sp.]MBD3756943.1 alpha/beta hydrolase [Microbacterium sp.]
MTARTARAVDVPVAGGVLRVGVWDAAPDAPTILAVHGVTSSHLAWQLLAEELPGVRIVAPDLRGRGQSNALAGPAGMAAHADDLAAVCAHLDIVPALVVAHSMGAFVAVVLAHRHPALVRRLVLVDGGLPLAAPADLAPDDLVAAILGPTAARLSMRFADTAAYLRFWREHPAFAADWSPELERYLAYDLVPVADGEAALRPATSYATTVEDTVDMNTRPTVTEALDALGVPTVLVTVPRGLQNETPGLYPPTHLAALLARYPAVEHVAWPGFNHYTVVLSRPGAARLADLVTAQLALAAAEKPLAR